MTVFAIITAMAFGFRPLFVAALVLFTLAALVVWRQEER